MTFVILKLNFFLCNPKIDDFDTLNLHFTVCGPTIPESRCRYSSVLFPDTVRMFRTGV